MAKSCWIGHVLEKNGRRMWSAKLGLFPPSMRVARILADHYCCHGKVLRLMRDDNYIKELQPTAEGTVYETTPQPAMTPEIAFLYNPETNSWTVKDIRTRRDYDLEELIEKGFFTE
jgi:hypothetical protein